MHWRVQKEREKGKEYDAGSITSEKLELEISKCAASHINRKSNLIMHSSISGESNVSNDKDNLEKEIDKRNCSVLKDATGELERASH